MLKVVYIVKYVEYFHRSIENYQYQYYKDRIKADYAKSMGNTPVELSYEDINSNRYIERLKGIMA